MLRNTVTAAAQRAADEAGFFAGLGEAGVLVRLRISEINPGQVTGYAVGLPGHDGCDGEPCWYGGGRLAAELRTFRGVPVHCSGTERDLRARGPPGRYRGGAHPPVRAR